MKRDPSVYDHFLRIQTELSWGLEQVLYRRYESWVNAKNVLDFGCGNGYHTMALEAANRDKFFTGVEIDPELAAIARTRVQGTNTAIVTGSYKDLPEDFRFDFLILRHVVSYLSDRPSFWEWVSAHASPRAGILVIDAADNHFYVEPDLPVFLEELRKFYSAVNEEGQRDITGVIRGELEKVGFGFVTTQQIVVNSEIPSTKEKVYLYMYLATELDAGSPLPPEVIEELRDWVLDPHSYIQWGLFGVLFDRGYEKHIYSNFEATI